MSRRRAAGQLKSPPEDPSRVCGDRVQGLNLQYWLRGYVQRNRQGRVHRDAKRAMIVGSRGIVLLRVLLQRGELGMGMTCQHRAHNADDQNAQNRKQPKPHGTLPFSISGLEEGPH